MFTREAALRIAAERSPISSIRRFCLAAAALNTLPSATESMLPASYLRAAVTLLLNSL